MGAGSFVGRIGGLAVALGVGAAMTAGIGIARADGTSAGSQGSSSASSPGDTNTRSTPNARTSPKSRPSLPKGPLSKVADQIRDGLTSGNRAAGAKAKAAKPNAQPDSRLKQDRPAPKRQRDTRVAPAPPDSDVDSLDTEQAAIPSEPTKLEPAPDATPRPKAAPAPTEKRTANATKPARKVGVRAAIRDSGASGESATSADTKPTATNAGAKAGVKSVLDSGLPDGAPANAATRIDQATKAIAASAEEGAREIAPALASVRREFDVPAITDIRAAVKSATRQFVSLAPQQTAPAAAPQQLTPQLVSGRLVSGLLAAAGVTPSAGTGPVIPAQPPVLLALVAWARREFERAINPAGTAAVSLAGAQPVAALMAEPVAAAVVDPNLQTPKPTAPVVGATTPLGWVTGPGITTAPYGTPGNYGIAGTDLGIMWDDGSGQVLMIFGDTFDQPNMQGVWRSNVLLRTADHDLSNGLMIQDAVISPGGVYSANEWSNRYGATQVIRDPGFLGLFGSTTTIIPTAAISVTDDAGKTTQYVNVMSVRTWDTPGRWTTNWSAIAYSTDSGTTWTVDPNTVRSSGWLRSSTPYVPGNQNFQQGAFVQGPANDVNAEGVQYVYSFGTPSGRGGSAYVARVPENEIRNLGAYEYWAGEDRGWVANDPSVAVPVIGATDQAPPTGFIGWITKAINDFMGGIVVGGLTGGNVSEISLQYNPYLRKYVALYTDGGNNVVMRVSDSPQGTWSDASVLVANNPLSSNTGMYAPMIHPWSGTDRLGANNEDTLYWNLSYWGPYNVQLLQTDLSPMGGASGTIAV